MREKLTLCHCPDGAHPCSLPQEACLTRCHAFETAARLVLEHLDCECPDGGNDPSTHVAGCNGPLVMSLYAALCGER